MDSELLFQYFPTLTNIATRQFNQLGTIYPDWNEKVNLISRADIAHLYEKHILHSLAIAKFINFTPGTKIMDLGTGGGFPGIPLAILFPEVQFTLVDSIGKKITVVKDIIEQLQLKNVVALNERAESLPPGFDFVVSRATAPLNELYRWTYKLISKRQQNAIPNGIICLKGGDLQEEIQPFKGRTEIVMISDYFKEDFFLTKKIVFLTT